MHFSKFHSVQALVSVSTIGSFEGRSDSSLAEEVKAELEPWFGTSVRDWQLLRNYRIPYAQPNQVPASLLKTPLQGMQMHEEEALEALATLEIPLEKSKAEDQ